jgi:protoporphyrinogen oxidase
MKFDTVIVGAGVTGLTLATLENPNSSVCIIAPQVGGLIHNYRYGEFSFDVGGHVYTTGDESVLNLVERAGGVEHERKALYRDVTGLVPYPVQANADKLGIKIVSTSNGEYVKGQNLKDWAIGMFGTDFYDSWYAPFNRRVWSTDPSEMDSDWVATRVAKPTASKSGWGPNARFIYAPGTDIENVLLDDAFHADTFMVDGTVIGADAVQKTVFTSGGMEISYKRLFDTTRIFTKPFTKANRIVTVGIGFNHLIDDDFTWVYPHISHKAHRVTLLSRYHPSLAPRGCDSIIIEYPYMFRGYLPGSLTSIIVPDERPAHQNSTVMSSIQAAVLCRYLGIPSLSNITPKDIHVAVAIDAQAYPVPTMGVRKVISVAKLLLEKYGVYLAGRWGSHGYFNLEHCIADAHAAHDLAYGDRSEISMDRYFNASFYYRR